jgi:hypothetical protein
MSKHPPSLLITHIVKSEGCTENNIGQARHAAPQDLIAGRRAPGAGEPAAQPCDLPDVAGQIADA